jgi:hypothetical protein
MPRWRGEVKMANEPDEAPASAPAPLAATADRIATMQPLSKLLLDKDNPRFGGIAAGGDSQTNILDHIVKTYGIRDVLSSLTVNGYFKAEPLVGRAQEDSDKVVIAEGNRRLAACLVLVGDERAVNQAALSQQAQQAWHAHGAPAVDPVPVILFGPTEGRKSLLSYLGVRHISASQPWDSYAKAAWVASVVQHNDLTVADVAQMVGDQHRTVARLLEGYYFIHQAERKGQFRPADSQRSGRGSVTAYPFSWVYTILGYASVRAFLDLDDTGPKVDPVPEEKLPRAGLLCRAMFGDRSKGLSAAISDSRQLGDLAAAFASPEKVALLERGLNITEIVRITKPIDERLRQGLAEVRAMQSELISGLTEHDISETIATAHLPAATANRRSASEIEKRLRDVAVPPADE